MHLTHRIITILLLVFFVPVRAQKSDITLKLKKGFTFQMELTNSASFMQEFMGINYTTETRLSSIMNLEVEDVVPDSGYRINTSYSFMEFFMRTPNLEIEVNSEIADSTNPMNIMMRSVTGKKFYLLLDSDGEIKEFSGLDELILEKVKAISLPEMEKTEFIENFIKSFGENQVRDILLQISAYYTDSLISKGSSWFRSMSVNPFSIPGHLILDIRVNELTGKYAMILAEGKFAARRNNELKEKDAAYNLTGTQVSEVTFDIKTGLIENGIITLRVNGKVRVSDPDSGNPIEMPVTINSRMSIITRK